MWEWRASAGMAVELLFRFPVVRFVCAPLSPVSSTGQAPDISPACGGNLVEFPFTLTLALSHRGRGDLRCFFYCAFETFRISRRKPAHRL